MKGDVRDESWGQAGDVGAGCVGVGGEGSGADEAGGYDVGAGGGVAVAEEVEEVGVGHGLDASREASLPLYRPGRRMGCDETSVPPLA